MKSGTNWLGSLLNSHPDVSCIGEFHWQEVVARFNHQLQTEPLFRDPRYQESVRRNFEKMIRESMVQAAKPGARVIGDRTPHTIVPVTLRNVPYLSIIRDGRDVLVSRAFHLYNSPDVHRLFRRIPEMAESLKNFQADPWYFRTNPEKLLCHETMVRESMAWWREHLHSDQATAERYPKLRVRFLKYEDLHADTVNLRNSLFEFLDVDPARVTDLSADLKPGFDIERPTEFFRKGAVGDWKNYFTDDVKRWVKDVAGDTLLQHGYVDSPDW